MKEKCVVIPAYEPDELMLDLVDKLNAFFLDLKIVIVNDGSVSSDEIFNKVKEVSNVTLLTHEVNKGKGQALKTAFNYLSSISYKGIIITADADGQHKPEDIKKVCDEYEKDPIGLYLGSRVFKNDVPKRSKFGNEATKVLFRLTNANYLNDNQTGLRVFGDELLSVMNKIKGSKYEYEMNMLLELSRKNVPINEVGIEAIYINGNKSSHFRPVRDFMKICRHIIKYALPGFISLCASIVFFIGGLHIFNKGLEGNKLVLVSASFAMVVAYTINFIINRTGIICGNKSLFSTKKKIGRYVLINSLVVISNVGLVVGTYALLNNFAVAKTIGEVPTLLVSIAIKYLLVPTPKIMK